MNSLFRKNIDAMAGYVPGKQISGKKIVKLNTNENPYPPTPRVEEILKNTDISELRKYPQPLCDDVREVIAKLFGYKKENVIVGNGSDDILTIAVRSFVAEGESLAVVDPTYSLYQVLAEIQGAETIKVPLNDDFSLPENLLEKIDGARLLLLPCPNAPTGNLFPKETIKKICRAFNGVVLIDEAYADFAGINCMELAGEFTNVIISRTLSKSYALAGIRFGFAVADAEIIAGMMKVKDSYNLDYITQKIAQAALEDQEYFEKIRNKVCSTRKWFADKLTELNFEVLESHTNFLFVSPPDGNAEKLFNFLSDNGFLTRYFPGERTGKYLRISIGTDEEMTELLNLTAPLYNDTKTTTF